MKIGVVILNWNGVDLLKKFLPSVNDNSEGHQIYIIDNNSKNLEHILGFNSAGYAFSENETKNSSEPVFIR